MDESNTKIYLGDPFVIEKKKWHICSSFGCYKKQNLLHKHMYYFHKTMIDIKVYGCKTALLVVNYVIIKWLINLGMKPISILDLT
jgi:hypothetical protein